MLRINRRWIDSDKHIRQSLNDILHQNAGNVGDQMKSHLMLKLKNRVVNELPYCYPASLPIRFGRIHLWDISYTLV